MLYSEKPPGFTLTFEVVGCYLVHAQKILLLHRHPSKPQGGTWDTPGGKIHPSELVLDAVIREVHEETGLAIVKDKIETLGTFYVVYPDIHFVYHVHRYTFEIEPNISIESTAHTEYRWVTPQEALTMPLIPDEDTCISMFFPDAVQK